MSASTYTPETLLKDLRCLGWAKQRTEEGTRLMVRDLVRSPRASTLLGLPQRHRAHDEALERLGLPRDLLTLIENGTLEREVLRAYERIDAVNARLDAWEAQNPDAATELPWFKSREAWKASGRPRVEWYAALRLTQGLRLG